MGRALWTESADIVCGVIDRAHARTKQWVVELAPETFFVLHVGSTANWSLPVICCRYILMIIVALFSLQTTLLADQAQSNVHDPIAFELPAQCRLGETCWVANYVDVDPSLAAKDFHCQPRTYDGHDGVDFAIRDRVVMEQGVPVLAAAPGIVRRVRDGVVDAGLTDTASREAIAGRECGNGVVIDHGDGWETQYCHLKQGSLRVTVGQQLDRGSTVGLIGLSGKTKFPHVHFTVRHDGRVIDPFTGQSNAAGCGTGGHALWRDPDVTYEDVALYHAGFSAGEPQIDAIRGGKAVAEHLASDSGALVLWIDIFGVQAEDRLRFRITAPDGRIILDRERRIDRTQARHFAFAGLRRPTRQWPSGLYRGELQIRRTGSENTLTRTVTTTVQVP